MFPSSFFTLFPPFARDNTCFVAMSFAPEFEARWKHVLEPAISGIQVNGERLRPIRVDQRTINDSILTEILTGITRCRLVLADITVLGHLNKRPVRNGNVMYEVGMAHAVRLPAEVVLFRSDDEDLLFDVANVRVNRYDPDHDPVHAFAAVQSALLNGLREVNLLQSLSTKRAAARLDLVATDLLFGIAQGRTDFLSNPFKSPAMSRLLEEEIVEAVYSPLTLENVRANKLNIKEYCQYRLTPFGSSVFGEITRRMEVAKLSEYQREIEEEKAAASTTATITTALVDAEKQGAGDEAAPDASQSEAQQADGPVAPEA
jgi:hypothetical protein